MARSQTGLGRRPRALLDQSATEVEVTDSTIVFGAQPDEKPEPAARKPAAKTDK